MAAADVSGSGQDTQTSLRQPGPLANGGSHLTLWPFVQVFAVAFLAFVVLQAKKRRQKPVPPRPRPMAAPLAAKEKKPPKSHFEVRI